MYMYIYTCIWNKVMLLGIAHDTFTIWYMKCTRMYLCIYIYINTIYDKDKHIVLIGFLLDCCYCVGLVVHDLTCIMYWVTGSTISFSRTRTPWRLVNPKRCDEVYEVYEASRNLPAVCFSGSSLGIMGIYIYISTLSKWETYSVCNLYVIYHNVQKQILNIKKILIPSPKRPPTWDPRPRS